MCSSPAPTHLPLGLIQRRVTLTRLIALTSAGLLAGCSSLPSFESGSSSSTRLPPPRREAAGEAGLTEPALHAFSLVGTPYKWGGNHPNGGFDCSGLVIYVMRRALGKTLPRTVEQMSGSGQEIPAEDRLPGDLVFFNTTGRPYSHVGIYIGQNRFVHAPREGGTVRLESLVSSYWGPRIVGFRRLWG